MLHVDFFARLLAHRSVNCDSRACSDRKTQKPGVELGDLPTLLEEKRAVRRRLAPPVDYLRRFTPPGAEEAKAEHLHDSTKRRITALTVSDPMRRGDSGYPGSG